MTNYEIYKAKAEKALERFDRMEDALKRSCHAPGCRLWTGCPEECLCRRERKTPLDSKTALRWAVAWALKQFSWGVALRDGPMAAERLHTAARVALMAAMHDRPLRSLLYRINETLCKEFVDEMCELVAVGKAAFGL